MDIIFYKSTDEVNSFPKTLTDGVTISGSLRSECDILNPIIEFTGIGVDIPYNYCYIPTFKRYYFIKEARSIRTGIIELSMHVDVLQSWKDDILNSKAYIERSEVKFNPYIVDDEVMLLANVPSIKKMFNTTTAFKRNLLNDALSSGQVVMTIAGYSPEQTEGSIALSSDLDELDVIDLEE